MIVFSRIRNYFTYIISAVCVLLLWQIYRYTQESSRLRMLNQLGRFDAANESEVVISVYYEALCPDSKSFILRHLIPAIEKAPVVLGVDFIPYGKAETISLGNDRYDFNCQHLSVECKANKVHACAIRYIKNKLILVNYIGCMISDNLYPEGIGAQCAERFSLDWSPILKCSQGREGEQLLKRHGETTAYLFPELTFVPTVLLNHNHHNQAHILKNLWNELCTFYGDYLRKECH